MEQSSTLTWTSATCVPADRIATRDPVSIASRYGWALETTSQATSAM